MCAHTHDYERREKNKWKRKGVRVKKGENEGDSNKVNQRKDRLAIPGERQESAYEGAVLGIVVCACNCSDWR